MPTYARRTDGSDADVFLLSGAEDLVPVVRGGSRVEVDRGTHIIHRYRPRTEGLFARIERWTHKADGRVHWRSITRDNITSIYGDSVESRVADSEASFRVAEWLITSTYDSKGNEVRYQYKAEDDIGVNRFEANERNRIRTSARYLKRILYGNTKSRLDQGPGTMEWRFQVLFDYGEHYKEVRTESANQHAQATLELDAGAAAWSARPDPFSSHRYGFEVRKYRRCHRILMLHNFSELGASPTLVRSLSLEYDDLDYSAATSMEIELAHDGSTRAGSFLKRAVVSGYKRDPNAIGSDTYLRSSLPPVEWTYSRAEIDDEVRVLEGTSLENLPQGVDGDAYVLADLHGEGLSGILVRGDGIWMYKRNKGGGNFGALEIVRAHPSFIGRTAGGEQLLDLDGDGHLDLVAFSGSAAGFYERTADGQWSAFRAFRSLPRINWDDPNLRFVDLTGDGHADVVITEQDAIAWHPSLEQDGYGTQARISCPRDDQEGPRLVFSDPSGTVFLADLSGDGLSDLVRIRNGEIAYWPNQGYARFGKKVAMDHAPVFDRPEQFDPERIRLVDTDGSGTADIIYLGPRTTSIYFNRSGNSWTAAHELKTFPQVDNLATVTTADILGKGTSCLVWSSPLEGDDHHPLRFISLMKEKPHLMVASRNNLGAETRIRYLSSTHFFLEDERNGEPWLDKLPFPTHVVERVETYDEVSRSRFVSRYTYHHGYYDGFEREFRGFGRVDRYDTEELSALKRSDTFPAGDNIDARSYIPPVLTKTWFHTGRFDKRELISRFFEKEYFREPNSTDADAADLLLEDTRLPGGLSATESRQACRTLRGSVLRQEVYGLDGPEQHLPYLVTEANYCIRRLQSQADNEHAVFFVHPCEKLSYHYERSRVPVVGNVIPVPPTVGWTLRCDPRTTHELVLQVDEFGTPTKTVSIGYGRRFAASATDSAEHGDFIRREQAKTHVLYTEVLPTNFVDTADDHRTPVPWDIRTYELNAYPASGPVGRYLVSDLVDNGSNLLQGNERLYEDPIRAGAPAVGRTRRLIEHAVSQFRHDDLSAALPFGTQQARGVPFEGYKLAFTPGLLGQLYGGRASDALLREAGYKRLAGLSGSDSQNWWLCSGLVHYAPLGQDELSEALRSFFLPRRAVDAFGNESEVDYEHGLAITEARDALHNQTKTRLDYRTLQQAEVIGPNGNRTHFAFDMLGRVAGTAAMGKVTETLGDSLDGFEADLLPSQIASIVNDPAGAPARASVGKASTRFLYDYSGAPQQPALSVALARELHHADENSPPKRVQVALSYSDGFGRVVQVKKQVRSGPAPTRDSNGVIEPSADNLPQYSGPDVERWVASGWLIHNNKGKPVREYEPFFTDQSMFEFAVKIGVSPTLFYDPIGRVVGTLSPDHTWAKIRFDPWHQTSWDASDTVLSKPEDDEVIGSAIRRLDPTEYSPTWYEKRIGLPAADKDHLAALRSAIHRCTPSIAHTDSLGRTIAAATHNRFTYPSIGGQVPVQEQYVTRTTFDIEGNEREVFDARGRLVMRYNYDMLGRQCHHASMEAGERWMLHDVDEQPHATWDSRGHRFRSSYDELRRPTESRLLLPGNSAEILVGATTYGETQAAAEGHNLRGQVFETKDQAGVVRFPDYDFKGNLVTSTRKLAKNYKQTLDWLADPTLEGAVYSAWTEFDALNRPAFEGPARSDQTYADASPSHSTVIRRRFDDGGQLQAVDTWMSAGSGAVGSTPADDRIGVSDIRYDAKGQRTRIAYNNGTETYYRYDLQTSRLRHLYTRRDAGFSADCDAPTPPGGTTIAPAAPPPDRPCGVQSLSYTYDASGNITCIRDAAQQKVYFNNAVASPDREFAYDAIGRLIEGTGREHLGQAVPTPHSYNDGSRAKQPHPNNREALVGYVERYYYDKVGNILQMKHRRRSATTPDWVRHFTYQEASLLEVGKSSNRLTATRIDTTKIPYSNSGDGYDAHGNMLRMEQLSAMAWNPWDQLQATSRQVVAASILNAVDTDGQAHAGEQTYYVYDASGERVRKVTERADGTKDKERLYLGGFEMYSGPAGLARESLHISDDQHRFALVETRVGGNDGSPKQLVRYQHGDHLGSACLELDDRAAIVSYEEYTPYGSTAYQAVRSQTEAPKRYRFTGMERDEESGLSYHSARYYAPWLGRWTAGDPMGLVDSVALYSYARSQPSARSDTTGEASESPAQLRQAGWSYLGEVDGHGHIWKQPGTKVQEYGQSIIFKYRVNGPNPNGEAASADGEAASADGQAANSNRQADPIPRHRGPRSFEETPELTKSALVPPAGLVFDSISVSATAFQVTRGSDALWMAQQEAERIHVATKLRKKVPPKPARKAKNYKKLVRQRSKIRSMNAPIRNAAKANQQVRALATRGLGVLGAAAKYVGGLASLASAVLGGVELAKRPETMQDKISKIGAAISVLDGIATVVGLFVTSTLVVWGSAVLGALSFGWSLGTYLNDRFIDPFLYGPVWSYLYPD